MGIFAQAQKTEEKEWIVLTYESQTSPESREFTYAYWVTEELKDETTGETVVPKPFGLYLYKEQEFGAALSHCLSETSVPPNSEPDYVSYISGIRDSLSNNRSMIQAKTSHNFVYNTRIQIKIYVSKIKCRLYICKRGDEDDPYGNRLGFPFGFCEVLPNKFEPYVYPALNKIIKEN